jgi:hypothetical protein
MVYSKNLLWLASFIEAAASEVDISLLKSIRGFRVPLSKKESNDGMITSERGRFSITLRTHNQEKRGYSQRSMYGVLTALAHELAHIEHWEHTAAHLYLESRILTVFAEELSSYDVKDYFKTWHS